MTNLPTKKLVLAKLKNVCNDVWYEVLEYVENEDIFYPISDNSTTFEGSYGHEDKVLAWEYLDNIKLNTIN